MAKGSGNQKMLSDFAIKIRNRRHELGMTQEELYSDRLNLSLFERLQLCQIDPPRRPCQFGNGAPRSERAQSALRFCFVSQSPNPPNLTVRGINAKF